MTNINPELTRIVKEQINKNPIMQNNTLAKKIHQEYKNFSTERIRGSIRYHKGQNGDKNRKKIGMEIELPKSNNREWTPYDIPTNTQKMLIINDLHLPYHDEKSIDLALSDSRGVDTVLLNGDILDFYMVSSFNRLPDAMRFKDEIKQGNQLLDYISKKLNNPKIIYKLGNHEERLDNYIMAKCPELWGMDGLNLASQLKAVDRDMTIINDKRVVKFGLLSIIHGHEYGRSFAGSPVNPARSLYLRAKASACAGHEHTTSQHSESDINGLGIGCWSIGALCDMHPQYRPLNKWNLGFARVERSGTSNRGFIFNNFKIIQGKVFPA